MNPSSNPSRSAQTSSDMTSRLVRSADKPLDRMDRLGDMGHFPVLVNAGATANILFTILVVFLLERWLPGSPLAATLPVMLLTTPLLVVVFFLLLNLAPVVLLRLRDKGTRPVPTLARMDFVQDQHRFSSWVYLAASANMAFWILTAWSVFLFFDTVTALLLTLGAAFLLTFSPVLLRRGRS